MHSKFNLKNKNSLIYNTLLHSGAHVGLNLNSVTNTKITSFIFFIENNMYFFNIKRISSDLKQSLLFIQKILINGGFVLIITGFKIKNQQ